ncbi:coproporphyrinogen III oxidase [Arachidicoccus ginsenosidimutans]|uniref:oxygen-dependent coproporphyrinogen oxidase n=1 Tax=Arachidicoccus sp. BS20 TaxID=1850526 RepID=UPI0007F0EEF7|nr:oxygen-dependent coproporphyrinogen oxidase [Arachidicoccus sp. BS20]ANI90205.1 coproporphyrinogen III oxidase [Arachidicoccus sp. BS20]
MQTETLYKTATKEFRGEWIEFVHSLQNHICTALEAVDGKAKFVEDEWQRNPDGKGGGGKTRVIANGNVFEKGGVNTSVVYGKVTEPMRKQLGIDGAKWFACGLSLVIHPLNPFVPTTHANWRYFELYDEDDNVADRWFGGGADLTPYYLFEEDAKHFHQTLKNAIEPFGKDLYPKYKKQCDEYFNNSHRGFEMRGIGGVFYDYLKPTPDMDLERLFAFQQANGNCFIDAYIPIVEKRKNTEWNTQHKYWQEIRRGRYVEFNLIHDRGTIFGLKTNGRTESILMSLPPTVRFDYNYQPAPNSEENKLLEACKNPVDWA